LLPLKLITLLIFLIRLAYILALIAPNIKLGLLTAKYFSSAYTVAKAKIAESVALTFKLAKKIIKNIKINIYAAEEYIDLIGTFETIYLKKLKHCQVILAC
jgi:hypothetical protein